jgi:titin
MFNVVNERLAPEPVPTIPATPSGLTATAVSESAVDLTWTDNAVDEAGFYLERSTDGEAFTRVAAVGVNATSYRDTGLTAGTKYYYRVQAHNSAGTSAWAAPASVTTVSPELPPPTKSAVTAYLVNADTDEDIMLLADGTEIAFGELGTRNLNVRAVVDGFVHESVLFEYDGTSRAENNEPYAFALDGPGGDFLPWTPTAGDHTLTITPYTLDNAAGTAGAPLTINFTVVDNSSTPPPTEPEPQPTTPATPSDLIAGAANSSEINLAWSDNSENETGFRIEQSTNGTTWSQVAVVAADVESHAITGLSASTTYYFRVRAYNEAGSSAYTTVASAKTPAAAPSPAIHEDFTAGAGGLTAIDGEWVLSMEGTKSHRPRRTRRRI